MNSGHQTLTLWPIGTMHTSSATKIEAPRQPAAASDMPGIIELFADQNLEHAIEDLTGWERIWVIFWFDRNPGWRPKVLPPRSTTGRKGVLATRSPHRPNPLGLSVLRLDRIDGLRLHVRDVDLLDGTPILDIKPYVPYTDAFADSGSGWLNERDPVPAYPVSYSELANAQLQWVHERSGFALRERVQAALSLGPQPHPYRRIKATGDDAYVLAVKDWRVHFTLCGREVQVGKVTTGYRASQLANERVDEDDALALHRVFCEAFRAG